jgi:hypothetical protein
MTRIQAITTIRALLSAGLTLREVAEQLQAHPRAVEALLRSSAGAAAGGAGKLRATA